MPHDLIVAIFQGAPDALAQLFALIQSIWDVLKTILFVLCIVWCLVGLAAILLSLWRYIQLRRTLTNDVATATMVTSAQQFNEGIMWTGIILASTGGVGLILLWAMAGAPW